MKDAVNNIAGALNIPSPIQEKISKAQELAQIGIKPFKLGDNTPKDVQRAERHLIDQQKSGKMGVDDKGTLTNQMVLGKMEDWIKLLIANLKNQDPTEPVDHKDMIAQFGTFAQTMGMKQITGFLEDLKRMLGTTQALEAAKNLDQLAKIEADTYYYDKNKPIGLVFDMPPEAAKGSVLISDKNGRLMNIIEGDFEAGENRFIWDGKNSLGEQVDEGIYKIHVIALDADGKQLRENDNKTPLTVKTYVVGKIHGSEMSAKGAHVKINNYSYPMENIRSLDVVQLQEISEGSPANQDQEDKPANQNDQLLEAVDE